METNTKKEPPKPNEPIKLQGNFGDILKIIAKKANKNSKKKSS